MTMRTVKSRGPAKLAVVLGLWGLLDLVAILGLTATREAPPVLADTAKYYLDCLTTEVNEGDSFDVYLVRVSNHQHNQNFGARWHTDPGSANTSDYLTQSTESPIWSTTAAQRAANRLSRTFQTTEDRLVEGGETFTVRFSPVSNVVDRTDPERDEKRQFTITGDNPEITDIEMASTPADDNTYGVGEIIQFQVTLSAAVDVEGVVVMGTRVGERWRAATYRSGSGTDKLIFGYRVKSEDRDDDGSGSTRATRIEMASSTEWEATAPSSCRAPIFWSGEFTTG